MTDNKDQIAATKSLTGYKHPPTKTRFQKGHSGNPRGRPKESRNLVTVLSEALNQSVTLKQDGKSRQVTKGDALIDVLLNMASKGERRAVDAVINLIGKIERLVEQPEERKNVGVMVVPGVAKSTEEWKQAVANWTKRKELQDQQRKIDAPKVRKKEAALRETIALHKGTPEGDAAAAALAELTGSMEYRSNFYIKIFPGGGNCGRPSQRRTSCETALGRGRICADTILCKEGVCSHAFPRREAKSATGIGSPPCLSPSQWVQSLEFGTLVRAPSRRPAPAGRTAQRRAMG